jgi:hypothetical protein
MAAALKLLEEIIGDPKTNASERLEAMRMLKMYLLQLKRLIEAQETAPNVREGVIEVLREYRQRPLLLSYTWMVASSSRNGYQTPAAL